MAVNIYENMRRTCKEHDTSLTTVLQKLNHSTGSTGGWKNGQIPKVDIVMAIADVLGVSMEELVYGKEEADARILNCTAEEREWLDIVRHIPADRKEMCKDFLRTHMVVPDEFSDRMSG